MDASRKMCLPAFLLGWVAPVVGQGLVATGPLAHPAYGIGDVTGDGADDLLMTSQLYEVRDGTTGALLPWLTHTNGTGTHYQGIGDHDGDGHDDVVWWQTGVSAAVLSGANGNTLASLPRPGFSFTEILGSGDFDTDGRSDLILVESGVIKIVSTRTQQSIYSPPTVFTYPDVYFTANLVTVRGFGDYNQDGYQDLIAFCQYLSFPLRLTLLLRGPNFTIDSTLGVIGDGSPAGEFVAGDLDGDGGLEFFSPIGSSPKIFSLSMTWNLTNFAPGSTVCGRVGDVDGDGRDDVYLGDGQHSAVYSGASHLPLAGTQPPVAARGLGDLDLDGRAEVTAGLTRYEWVAPALPIASQMVRRGHPGIGSAGRRPTLATRGSCGLGRIARLDISGAQPSGLTMLAFGDSIDVDLGPMGAPGSNNYTTASILVTRPTSPSGFARHTVYVTNSSALLGASISVQAVVFDPAANALALVTSNAIDLSVHN